MIKLVLIIFVIVIFVGAGYFLGGVNISPQTASITKTKTKTLQPVKNVEWLTYRDQTDGFSLKYPPDWGVMTLSGSTIVAPRNRIEKFTQLSELGNFGGSRELTLQIFVEDGSGNTEVYPSSTREMTKKSVKLGQFLATEYLFTWKESLPGGIEPGTKSIAYVLNPAGNQVRIDLLDLQFEDTLKKIASSLSFSKVPKLTVGQLVGKTLNEVSISWGIPNLQKTNIDKKREVWVYTNSGDSTATYLYFENGKVMETKLDEFNGTLDSDPFLN